MMDARDALTYLERVVEDRADMDPGIGVAVAVLSGELERTKKLEWALGVAIKKLETLGELSIPYATEGIVHLRDALEGKNANIQA